MTITHQHSVRTHTRLLVRPLAWQPDAHKPGVELHIARAGLADRVTDVRRSFSRRFRYARGSSFADMLLILSKCAISIALFHFCGFD